MNLRLFFSAVLVFLLAVAARAADRLLQLDFARSRIEFDVKATVDSFTGHVDAYEASLLAAPDARTITKASFRFYCADLKTGKAKRDREMLEWLHAEKYPDGVFELTSLDPVAGNRLTARGKLTLLGVTKPLEFPVTVAIDKDVYAVDGEAVVDHREFGLPMFRKFGFFKVDPLVKVRFHLQGTWAQP